MKIGLLGHGTIGVGVDHITAKQPDMEVTRILSLVIDDEMRTRAAADVSEIINDPEIDTVVEVMGGVHPAYEFLSAAISAGKNAVTANKAVVAAYYKELSELAAEKGVFFRYTAAVGGGIPWLTSLSRSARVDTIKSVSGIMNGTTNYILTLMEGGESFDAALKKAQELGFAEADPTADIDGLDVRRKIAISACVAYGALVDEEEIPTLGIRYITSEDINYAKETGKSIKLMAFAKKEEELSAYVLPVILPADAPEANVSSNFNMISLNGEFLGDLKFYGQGAGRYPTAANVVQDLADIIADSVVPYQNNFAPASVSGGDKEMKFYIRKAGEAAETKTLTLSQAVELGKSGAFVAAII